MKASSASTPPKLRGLSEAEARGETEAASGRRSAFRQRYLAAAIFLTLDVVQQEVLDIWNVMTLDQSIKCGTQSN
jgi:hypothetical protein